MFTRKLVAVALASAALMIPSVAVAQEEGDAEIPVEDLPQVELDLTEDDPVEVVGEEYRCHGLLATIVGTDGDDVIEGTPERDVIVALGGDDVIYGKGGSDIICAGAGEDTIRGHGGHDAIFGGRGNDRIFGGSRGDFLHGGAGDDELFGRTGRDLLVGGSGDDLLAGNRHADWLEGGPGNDLLKGGKGRPDVCIGGLDFDVATRSCEVVVSAA